MVTSLSRIIDELIVDVRCLALRETLSTMIGSDVYSAFLFAWRSNPLCDGSVELRYCPLLMRWGTNPMIAEPGIRDVRVVTPPQESGIAHLYPNADMVDAYAVTLPAGATHNIDVLARAMLGRSPWWVSTLLSVRNTIMAMFGVKSTDDIRSEAGSKGTETIGFFPIRSRSERELIVGEDDRHLDFRASVLLRAQPGETGFEVIATTVVHCHNRLGRLYLALIMPFHRLIVRSGLRRAARSGWS
jgi:hypothetical protein